MHTLRLIIFFMMGTISISGVAYSSSGNSGKGSSDSISKLLQDDKNKQTKDESKNQTSGVNTGLVDTNLLSNINGQGKNQPTGESISKLDTSLNSGQIKDESKSQDSKTNIESVSNNILNNISNKDKDQAMNGSDKGSEQQTGKVDTGINLGQVNITPLVIEPEAPVTLYEKVTGIFDDASNKELLEDNLSGSDNLLGSVLGDDLYKNNIALETDINPGVSENTLALNLDGDILSAVPEPETYIMLLVGLMLLALSINRGNKSNRKAKSRFP